MSKGWHSQVRNIPQSLGFACPPAGANQETYMREPLEKRLSWVSRGQSNPATRLAR